MEHTGVPEGMDATQDAMPMDTEQDSKAAGQEAPAAPAQQQAGDQVVPGASP